MRLWLIGMMGSGKTSVGRLIAERRDLIFVDTDLLISSVSDQSIPELWDDKGEEAFRRLERDAVIGAAEGDAGVIATGGGVVIDPANSRSMRDSGFVVWLTATPEALTTRIGPEAGRPLLVGVEPKVDVLRRILAERADLYEAAAHVTVPTEDRPIEAIADDIEDLWTAT